MTLHRFGRMRLMMFGTLLCSVMPSVLSSPKLASSTALQQMLAARESFAGFQQARTTGSQNWPPRRATKHSRQFIQKAKGRLHMTGFDNDDDEETQDLQQQQPPPLFDLTSLDGAARSGTSRQGQQNLWVDADEDDDSYEEEEKDREEHNSEKYERTNGSGTVGENVFSRPPDQVGFGRDEDEMQTEREDRLYMDDVGRARRIETCVLVGVEDLSAMRTYHRSFQAGVNEPYGGDVSPNVASDDVVYFTLEESMVEMRELIKTAGMELIGEITQRLHEPNPKTYIGTGKVRETEEMLNTLRCNTVVFDAELTPGQQKALENAFNKKVIQNDFKGAQQEAEIKVIDRTALILDIFGQHAKTREGKLQVELALHVYRKPRLTRMWTHLERQSGAGGVGLRGPGESQLEIDKRLVRDRIIALKEKINDVQKQRDLHRRGRSKAGLPILALVGYTNAGKSTLLNYLTRAGVMAENILFATLDPTTRKVQLPTHPEVLLTDTVGFIQKLPTQLVAAFRATLEEVREADVLIHVVDVSNPSWEKQEAAVCQVLQEIGAGGKPMVRVLNKMDKLPEERAEIVRYETATSRRHSVAVSSLTGQGMEDFVLVVERALSDLLVNTELLLPYDKGNELNVIHEVGHVDALEYQPVGCYVSCRVPRAVASRLHKYVVGKTKPTTLSQQTEEEGSEEDIDWAAIARGRHSAKKKKGDPNRKQ